MLPDLPAQAEVDRLLSVYEAWVQVDVALPDAHDVIYDAIYIAVVCCLGSGYGV